MRHLATRSSLVSACSTMVFVYRPLILACRISAFTHYRIGVQALIGNTTHCCCLKFMGVLKMIIRLKWWLAHCATFQLNCTAAPALFTSMRRNGRRKQERFKYITGAACYKQAGLFILEKREQLTCVEREFRGTGGRKNARYLNRQSLSNKANIFYKPFHLVAS